MTLEPAGRPYVPAGATVLTSPSVEQPSPPAEVPLAPDVRFFRGVAAGALLAVSLWAVLAGVAALVYAVVA